MHNTITVYPNRLGEFVPSGELHPDEILALSPDLREQAASERGIVVRRLADGRVQLLGRRGPIAEQSRVAA